MVIMCSAGSYNSDDGPGLFAHLLLLSLSFIVSEDSYVTRKRLVRPLRSILDNGRTLAPTTSYEEIRTFFSAPTFLYFLYLMAPYFHYNLMIDFITIMYITKKS